MTDWSIEHVSGVPAELHARTLPDPPRRSVWVFTSTRSALVLGSTQRLDVVDHDEASRQGVEVIRRSTGGGAVLIDPGAAVWVDVVLPSGDALWNDDISASTRWLGAAWATALRELGMRDVDVHGEAMCHTKLSRLICFAGLGPGEVSMGGAKVVGIAQRRTRAGARFQSVVLRDWSVERWASLLRPGLESYGGGWLDELERIGVATVDVEGSRMVEAFLGSLP